MGKRFFDDDHDDRRSRGRGRDRHSHVFEDAPYVPPTPIVPQTLVAEKPAFRDGEWDGSVGGQPPRRPSSQPAVTGQPEKATVKWFNTEKGFGFVVDAKGQDLFLHISVVKAAGLTTVEPNQEIVIQRGPGRKGGDSANRIVV